VAALEYYSSANCVVSKEIKTITYIILFFFFFYSIEILNIVKYFIENFRDNRRNNGNTIILFYFHCYDILYKF
jgi:hypothetical protein